MAAQDEAGSAERDTLRRALLPPLRFAARDDFRNVTRLAGVDSLVDAVLVRAGLHGALADSLRAVAHGFDAAEPAEKRARVQQLLRLLDDPATPAPPVSATTTMRPASTSATSGASRSVSSTSRASRSVSSTSTKPPRDAPAALATAPSSPRGARPPASVPTSTDPLTWPVHRIKGVGPQRAQQLIERGLATVGDVVFTVPRTFEDRREKRRIVDLEDGVVAVTGGVVQVAGVVSSFGGPRGRRFEATIDDGSGLLRLIFFHFRQPELEARLARGAVVTVAGEVKKHQGRVTMIHPRLSTGQHQERALGGVSPVYPELKGLHPLELARVAKGAVELIRQQGPVPDPLPAHVVRGAQLLSLQDALVSLHAPSDDLDAEALRALVERRSPGHQRLAFEELFVLGAALSLRRHAQGADPAPALTSTSRSMGADDRDDDIAERGDTEDAALARMLPFVLTRAQQRAIHEIRVDLERPTPMARLLQGDVGAGKTAVAAAAALRAARAGYQTAFMAPTEVLAAQHGRTLKKLGQAIGLRVEVITGSVPKKARGLLQARLRNRDIDVVVGTQALLSEGVDFARLGLCIVDEQHRFGVVQRALLRRKGPVEQGVNLTPHLLVMTATPIPRSLTLTVYGDLAVSILDELPPGRTPIITKLVRDLHSAIPLMRETLARDERAFVVYPLIEESEKLDVAAATAGAVDLAREFRRPQAAPGGDYDDVVLLHGKMSPGEKEAAMTAFSRGDKRVLVSTTVIEVGVDVPQATLMIIVNAERFGLAQLHQLRGRVGRGGLASTCLLVSADASPHGLERLKTLEATTDGFVIAEKDLELRGPGDVLGTRQSGLPTLAFSDLAKHAPLIEVARGLADDVVAADPTLSSPANRGVRRLVWERYADRLALTAAG
jgi:ATP-dependent DNA helicase RecG